MNELKHTHDLRLPDYGPYTKTYMGISHIANKSEGLRFDLSVFPGFYRRRVDIPNVRWESGYHPWDAAADLSYFSYRHELEWKDQVYCDTSFSEMGDKARLIASEFVNRTSIPQNVELHYMASLNAPPFQPAEVVVPEGAVWVDALDYEDLQFARPRPSDNLVYDGQLRGERRQIGFVRGSGIGGDFGQDAGDKVSYSVAVDRQMEQGILFLRYRMENGRTARWQVEGPGSRTIALSGTGNIEIAEVDIGKLSPGACQLRFKSLGDAPIELDGFVLAERDQLQDVRFNKVERALQPIIETGPAANSMVLKYPEVQQYYGLLWVHDGCKIRQFHNDELDRFLRLTTHNHVKSEFAGNEKGHFSEVYMRPIFLEPGETKVIYGMLCTGTKAEVVNQLRAFAGNLAACERIYAAARKKSVDLTPNPSGEKYVFSQKRMAATTLTNIVFPVYTKRSNIRHYTPGRWWDSLYTWDAGFIGLGLAELDPERAVDCLNAYVTEPDDQHAAFIHHGSPVPTQIYLFQELWNRTQSTDLLRYFYPRLRRYYRFLCGHFGSSTTRTFKSNLIRTWDYFYNSGGWDDYPPQQHVHRHRLQNRVVPVVSTAHCIRAAKILRMAASQLGKTGETSAELGDVQGDIRQYDADIAMFGDALQQYSWDESSGYFGYVCHDEHGAPAGILRHESGSNFNMGLDGASPLIAGICTTSQEKKLLQHLSSKTDIWTEIGMSTVDQSAPYYEVDGYWNGAVWMPYQWFFWKTMLDLGEAEFARRIARTGLELWQREVEATYNCYEHFIVQTGRGAGWHQFGGLSTPVLSWFGAYHRPKRLTCGFDVWISEQRFSDSNRQLDAVLQHFGVPGRTYCIAVTMNPEYDYEVIWNGEKMPFSSTHKGVLEVRLTSAQQQGELQIKPCAATNGK